MNSSPSNLMSYYSWAKKNSRDRESIGDHFLVSLYYREYFAFNYTIGDALSGRTLKCIYIPKGVLRNLCMDAHVDLVIFGNQNILSIPL